MTFYLLRPVSYKTQLIGLHSKPIDPTHIYLFKVNQFQSMFHFYIPWKNQKTSGFRNLLRVEKWYFGWKSVNNRNNKLSIKTPKQYQWPHLFLVFLCPLWTSKCPVVTNCCMIGSQYWNFKTAALASGALTYFILVWSIDLFYPSMHLL